MEGRAGGKEERPPAGLKALPQTVLPDMYGSIGEYSKGSYRIVKGNQMESTAAGYTGVLATLVFAPLAWSSPSPISRWVLPLPPSNTTGSRRFVSSCSESGHGRGQALPRADR